MAALLSAMVAVMAAQASIPPPGDQATANCSRPIFATDQLVCSDDALRASDEALATALRTFTARPSIWLEPQSEWFKRRSRCAFASDQRACVAAAYFERAQVIRPWPATIARQRLRCVQVFEGAVAFDGERIGIFDQQGNVAGVATMPARNASWRPFLTSKRKGSTVEFRSASEALRCRTGR